MKNSFHFPVMEVVDDVQLRSLDCFFLDVEDLVVVVVDDDGDDDGDDILVFIVVFCLDCLAFVVVRVRVRVDVDLDVEDLDVVDLFFDFTFVLEFFFVTNLVSLLCVCDCLLLVEYNFIRDNLVP